jgi:hypothetical protein
MMDYHLTAHDLITSIHQQHLKIFNLGSLKVTVKIVTYLSYWNKKHDRNVRRT